MSMLEEINHLDTPDADEERYRVSLPDFYGPMDLLLDLIEREELEITRISLAQVTDQYLDYVTSLQEINPDNLTDFLVVASRLILLKSQVLLPKPPPGVIDEAEAETDDLVQQLKDYKRFKQLAQELQTLEAEGKRNFIRLAAPLNIEPRLRPGEAKVTDLLKAVRRALTIKPEQPAVDTIVARQIVTIGAQINMIRTRLREQPQLPFETLLTEARSRVEIIVTFLAVLELLKRRLIEVQQADNFGQITLLRPENQALTADEWAALEDMTEIS